jgi:hypothetical protein
MAFGQTGTDMASLENKIQEAEVALARAEPTSAQRELRDLQDEFAYLRVKARRGETVTERERRDLRDRIDRFTARMNNRSQNTSWDQPNRDNSSGTRDGNRSRDNTSYGRGDRSVPAGSELDVRLNTRLSSKDAMVEDRIEATTVVDLYGGDDLLVPAGSLLLGHVTAVDKATRTDRKGSLTVEFSRLTVNGRTRDVRATVTQALESEGIKGEAARVGAGAGVGAIIGGIIGGVKGAIAGILIGGGGVLAATEGKDVDLPAGTILRVRFETAVRLTLE